MAKATSKEKPAKSENAVRKTTTSTSRRRAQLEAASTRRSSGAGQSTDPVRQTKTALVREILAAKDGATISDLCAATGWQAHTVRAALSGLRKAGLTIERARDEDGASRYRIVGSGDDDGAAS